MTSLVSFRWFTLIKFHRIVFFLSNMDLLTLPNSFSAEFSKRTLELFKKNNLNVSVVNLLYSCSRLGIYLMFFLQKQIAFFLTLL